MASNMLLDRPYSARVPVITAIFLIREAMTLFSRASRSAKTSVYVRVSPWLKNCLTTEPLILKKNFNIYSDALRSYSDDFTGHHAGFSCRRKGDCHGNFLPDRELPGRFNKNAAGTNIADRCDKCTISGFARRCRQ